jgi:hypothetical protein
VSGLLRADWIRFRHRYDLWVILLAVLVLGVVSYASGVGSANSPFQVEPIDPTLPPDVRAMIEAQNAQIVAQMAAVRDLYVFPRSVVTMLVQGSWLFMAAAFVAASWIATEFDWGTLRNVVLFEPRRGRVLAARIVSLIAVTLVALVALAGLGAAMPLVMPTVGSGGPSGVTPGAVLLTAFAGLTWCVAFIAVAALAAVVTRSPILALILTYGYFLLESLVDNLTVWESWGSPLEWGRQFLLGFRLNALNVDVRLATGLDQPFEGAPSVPPIHLEPALGLLVVLAWIALALGAATLVLRRADIRE